MLDKDIALHIIKAQICSEAGKYKRDTYNAIEQYNGYCYPLFVCTQKRYHSKEYHIKKALDMVCSRKNTGFYFNVQPKLTDGGRDSLIVYFNFKLDGVRNQISFHTFDFKQLSKYISPNSRTRWLKGAEENASVRLFKYLF